MALTRRGASDQIRDRAYTCRFQAADGSRSSKNQTTYSSKKNSHYVLLQQPCSSIHGRIWVRPLGEMRKWLPRCHATPCQLARNADHLTSIANSSPGSNPSTRERKS